MPEPSPFPSPARIAIVAAAMGSLGLAVSTLLMKVGEHYLALPEDAVAVEYVDAGAPAEPGEDAPVASSDDPGMATPLARPTIRPRAANVRNYEIIVRRNIFDSTAVYNPDALVPGGGDCRDSSVKLIATVVADIPEYSSALISVSGGKDSHAQGFVIGDEVAGEGRITSIDQKKVCTDGGACICMGNESGLGKPDAAVAAGGGDPDSGITKISDTKFLVDQSVIDGAMGSIEMLAGQVHASPHKGPDGQVDGYRLSAIRKGTLLEKLGIKNGDIIKGVNGTPLTSAEGAMSTFTSLSSQKNFTFDVTRRSQDTTLEYEIR